MKSEIKKYILELPNYLTLFISPYIFLLASPILIDISDAINSNPGDLSIIFTAYTIGSIFGQLTSGLFTLKFKKKKIIILSYITQIFSILILIFLVI